MKLWIFHHYATLPNLNGFIRPYNFAKNIRKNGVDSTVFAASYQHFSDIDLITDGARTLINREFGTPFMFVKTPSSKEGCVSRIGNMLGFYRGLFGACAQYARECGTPDVILASSPHPLTMIAGIKIAKKYRVPCICEVRDLWPEAIFNASRIGEKSVIGKILTAGEHWIYRHADAIIFTKQGDTDYLKEHKWTTARGGDIDLSKCYYINNGVELSSYHAQSEAERLDDGDLNDGKFRVIYTGALRRINNVGNILDAAALTEDKDIVFLIYGDGNQADALRRRVIDEGLTNVKIKGFVDKKYLPYILSRSSVNLLNYSQTEYNWTRGSSSNKLFEYLASGKPVISTIKTGYSIIGKYKCGIELDEHTPEALADAVSAVKNMPQTDYRILCDNARNAAKDFDYALLSEKLTEVINRVRVETGHSDKRRLSLYFNTIRHLKLKQIAGRLKKPFVMRGVLPLTEYKGSFNTSLRTVLPTLDTDSDYLARFDIDGLMRNELTLVNETHTVDINTWDADGSALRSFNLHYFEYAVALAAAYADTRDCRYYEKFKELVGAWITANPACRKDAWHPYTISVRLPNWCICFDLFGDIFRHDAVFYNKVIQSMYMQYRVLIKRQETWQLGNHYLENLKAIVLCSLLFDEQSVFEVCIVRFLKEVETEILGDGVHFELSIMYHKVILEDLLRVANCLSQADKPQYKELLPVIGKMVSAVASLEKGMGKTPFFNDASDGVAKTGRSLCLTAREFFGIVPVFSDEFTASGYYKLYDGDIALMADVGEIGPSYMSGHGHCDCLSFELSVDGKPVFVNSGVLGYQGELRGYFRSTAAHNTVMIGKKEQSECWGEHRTARRISDIRAEKKGQTVTGGYKSCHGDRHTRSLTLADNVLTVLDSVRTRDGQAVHSFLHLAPSFSVAEKDVRLQVFSGNKLVCEIDAVECQTVIHRTGRLAGYASRFGRLENAETVEFFWHSDRESHGYTVSFKGDKEL